MNKIVKFKAQNKKNNNHIDSGYNYFSKAVLDSLCDDDEEDSDDYLIQIEDQAGDIYQISDAYLDRKNKIITLIISDRDDIRGI